MVLPGTYTVRLTVDGKSRQRPVEVTVDPLVKVSPADLRQQQMVAIELRDPLLEVRGSRIEPYLPALRRHCRLRTG